jgi:hypothetical protein
LHPAYRLWKARLGRLAFHWAPLVLRAAAGAAAALRVAAALAARLRGENLLGAWRAGVRFLPAAAQPAAAALAAVLQLLALTVLAAGFPRRAVSAGALLFLLVEALRAFQGPWDPIGVLSLTAALLLYLLRPANPSGGASPAPVTRRSRRAG